jgi:hypothetical protein
MMNTKSARAQRYRNLSNFAQESSRDEVLRVFMMCGSWYAVISRATIQDHPAYQELVRYRYRIQILKLNG